jgi:hypothetical protein
MILLVTSFRPNDEIIDNRAPQGSRIVSRIGRLGDEIRSNEGWAALANCDYLDQYVR